MRLADPSPDEPSFGRLHRAVQTLGERSIDAFPEFPSSFSSTEAERAERLRPRHGLVVRVERPGRSP